MAPPPSARDLKKRPSAGSPTLSFTLSHRHEPTHGILAIGRRPEETAQSRKPGVVVRPSHIGTSQLMARSPLPSDLKKRHSPKRATCHPTVSHRHEPTHDTLAIGKRPKERAQRRAPRLVNQPPPVSTIRLMTPSPLAGNLRKRPSAQRQIFRSPSSRRHAHLKTTGSCSSRRSLATIHFS